MTHTAWRVFYSYSHKDAELRERLATYLAPLHQQQKIVEWCDRKIEPGGKWDTEMSAQLEAAHLVLFLVSADFLASEYCFGVEVEKALARLKRGEVKVVPILLKPCLWEESRSSELQIIPRDAKAISAWASPDEALTAVASEIRHLIAEPPPGPAPAGAPALEPQRFDASLDLIRAQVRSYAHRYERTRQRMRPSDERTRRMEQIFAKLYNLAPASYPLLAELARSPSPGERLAAVAILQVFAAREFLPFLVQLVGAEKPFVGYHAAKALQFAAGALDPGAYPLVLKAIKDAQAALMSASEGLDSGRQVVLRAGEEDLQKTLQALAAPTDTLTDGGDGEIRRTSNHRRGLLASREGVGSLGVALETTYIAALSSMSAASRAPRRREAGDLGGWTSRESSRLACQANPGPTGGRTPRWAVLLSVLETRCAASAAVVSRWKATHGPPRPEGITRVPSKIPTTALPNCNCFTQHRSWGFWVAGVSGPGARDRLKGGSQVCLVGPKENSHA